MKNPLLVIGCVLWIVFSSRVELFAQLITEEQIILQPSELLIENPVGTGNAAYINQKGLNNEVNLIQDKDESELLQNLTRILQNGRKNIAAINQIGSNNQVALIQDGNRNLYELISDGNNIQVAVIQDGRRNEIIQSIENSSNIYVEFEQRGNDNSIIQEVDNLHNEQYIIRQIGNEMSVIIRQSGG